MLEAFYVKTCLAKCFGNCLEMYFEYSHVSVAQKTDRVTNFRLRPSGSETYKLACPSLPDSLTDSGRFVETLTLQQFYLITALC